MLRRWLTVVLAGACLCCAGLRAGEAEGGGAGEKPAEAGKEDAPVKEEPKPEESSGGGTAPGEEGVELKETPKKPGKLTQQELDALLGSLEEKQQKVEGFAADFLNQKESALVFEVVESKGRLVFIKPNHFYREVRGEDPVTVMAHNDVLLLYFPKERKAEKYFLRKDEKEAKDGENKSGGKDDIEGMLTGLSFDRKKLEKRFRLNAVREKDGRVRVDLLPLKKDDPMLKYLVRVSLWTDGESPWPAAVETESPDGDISRDTFSGVQNVAKDGAEKVLAEVFSMRLPGGTKIMTPQK
ncbi:MAG: hypothetical protein JW909_03270 [Planctomycetes bacterium]|nr:hypothetical protein [Planctomycetota bacterium]